MTEVSSPVRRHRRLPPLAALRAFEAAARQLSFRRAAEELNVTPTAISHQVRLLEDTLGVALFVRLVRRVALTEAGLRLYPTLRDGFDGFARAVADLWPPSRPRTVTITAPMLFTARRLLPALGSFRACNPDFDLRLHASDELVDLTGGVADIAVRYGAASFGGMVAEPLLHERVGVLCSPRLGLKRPDDLRHATLLHVEWKRPDKAPDWRRWVRLAGIDGLAFDEGPRFTEDEHVLQAAVGGVGVAIASLVMAKPELDAGLLVNPFGPTVDGEAYHVVAPAENLARADVAGVRDWLMTSVAGFVT